MLLKPILNWKIRSVPCDINLQSNFLSIHIVRVEAKLSVLFFFFFLIAMQCWITNCCFTTHGYMYTVHLFIHAIIQSSGYTIHPYCLSTKSYWEAGANSQQTSSSKVHPAPWDLGNVICQIGWFLKLLISKDFNIYTELFKQQICFQKCPSKVRGEWWNWFTLTGRL